MVENRGDCSTADATRSKVYDMTVAGLETAVLCYILPIDAASSAHITKGQVDTRTHRLGRLRNGMLPVCLQCATHHQQITVLQINASLCSIRFVP